ncbi:unnamed protein product [Coregonus sp. 'balchen']|nr:unnamed protein product [Coregonus sp. 'balchen']
MCPLFWLSIPFSQCFPAGFNMVVFPSSLTEEEESLQKKYAKLKKKKKALLALKKQQSSTSQTNQSGLKRTLSDQPVLDTATATEQAKMLIKSGAISAIKSENKNSGFKRSRTLEIKLKDPEKVPGPVAFQPFQRSMSTDDELSEAGKRAHRKSLYESFVTPGDRAARDEDEGGGLSTSKDIERERDRGDREMDRERERDRERDRGSGDRGRDRELRDRERTERDRSRDGERDQERGGDRESRSDSYPERRGVRKGNTVYVYGTGLVEDSLRSAFSQHGTIIDLSMDSQRNCAFITFEKMESADQAVAEVSTVPVKSLDTPTHSRVFIYFYYFLHCRIIAKTSTL